MTTNGEEPRILEEPDFKEEMGRLWNDVRETAKAATGRAKDFTREHPGLVALAALLSGVWLGLKLRK